MKKLLARFIGVGYVLTFGLLHTGEAFAMELYSQNEWNIALDGEFAGYTLYNRNDANYDKRWQAIGYGSLGFDIDRELGSDTAIGIHTSVEIAPESQYSDKETKIGDAYVSLECAGGRIEIGNTANISRKIHIFTPDVAIMDMDGVNGLDFILRKNDVRFLTTTAINTDENKTKVNYISPRIYGFQIAGSYIPKTESIGMFDKPEFGKLEDGFTYGVKYSYDGDINFKISANIARFNDVLEPESITNERNEYSVGALIYRKGLQLSTSYRHINEDRVIGIDSQEGYVADGGIAYEIGPFSISLTQRHSKLDRNTENKEYDRMNLTLLSTKYAMMQYMAVSTGFGRIALDGEDDKDKVGFVFIGGLLLSI